jgi:HK97 family phage portal protein
MAIWPFKGKQQGEEQRAIERWPWDVGGPPPYVPVDVDKALKLVPVFGAARFLADNIAAMPLRLLRSGPDGVLQRLPDPPLFNQPSVHGTSFDWVHRCVTSMALGGDAVGYTTARDYYGFPTMVEWLDPNSVAVYDGQLSGPGSYMDPIWTWMGRQVAKEDIVHIPWFCRPYKIRGHSPISAFQLTANIGLGAQEYASDWFANGGVPPGVMRNALQKVSSEDARTIATRITNRLRTRQPLIIGNDWEYTPIAIKPHEAEFVATCQLTATQIAVIYGMPPDKLGGTTGNSLTYSTVEQNSVDLLTFTLRPWLVRIEKALSNLFPRGTYVRFDPAELLRMDALSKAQVDAISLGYYPPGWKAIGEVRAGNDLPPIAGDQLPPPYRPGTAAAVPSPTGDSNTGTDDDLDSSESDTPPNPPTPQQRQMQLLERRWDSSYPTQNTTRDRWLVSHTNGNGRHPASAGA